MKKILMSMVFVIGCAADIEGTEFDASLPDEDSELVTTDEPIDTNTDTLLTTDPVPDPISFINPCKDYDPDPVEYKYMKYPGGPFGFKGAVCRDVEGATVTQEDTIHNICLPDHAGNRTCLDYYYNFPDVDLIFVKFSYYECPPCQIAAQQSEEFKQLMWDRGYSIAFITILMGATKEQAADWKYNLDPYSIVLYDLDKFWMERWITDIWPYDSERAYPTFYIVGANNMHIWDSFIGWYPFSNGAELVAEDVTETLDELSAEVPELLEPRERENCSS